MSEIFLCATPLGNLEDITKRVLRVLQEADLIAAEDTRHTQKLLNYYEIHTPTTSYHEHNETEKIPVLLAELERGKKIAVVSDAGMPCISDPGYLLVTAALKAGHQVSVVPGPSAVVSALAVSGLKPYPFYFQGFLPRGGSARREMLSELVEENRTGVFYEAPHRLLKSLTDFRDIWGENRRVSVARELTKQFEEVRRGTFGEMVTYFTANPPRGELTLVTDGKVYGEERIPGDPAVIRSAVEALMKAGAGPQTACKMVAKALGLAKGQVYRIYHRV